MNIPALPDEGKLRCEICGLMGHSLTPHLIAAHGISGKEYVKQFPGRPVTSAAFKEARSRATAGVANPNFGKGTGVTPRPRKLKLPEESKIKCQLCEYKGHNLAPHVNFVHGVAPKAYAARFSTDLWSGAFRAWKSASSSGPQNFNFGVSRPMPVHVREILNKAHAEKSTGENNPAKRPEVRAKMCESAQSRYVSDKEREVRAQRGRETLTRLWKDDYEKMHTTVVQGRASFLDGLLRGHPSRRTYKTYEGVEIAVMGDLELALCKWLDKNMFDWAYNDKIRFPYRDRGRVRAYFPDFVLQGTAYDFIEVKKHRELSQTVKKVDAVRVAGKSILVVTERTFAKFKSQGQLPTDSPR